MKKLIGSLLLLAACSKSPNLEGHRYSLCHPKQKHKQVFHETIGMINTYGARKEPLITFYLPKRLHFTAYEKQSKASMKVVAFSNHAPKEVFQGNLISIADEIDLSTGMIKAEARFDPTSPLFRCSSVHIKLLLAEEYQLLLPPSALWQKENSAFVYLQKPSGTIVKRSVKLGEKDDRGWQIVTEGLHAKDEVLNFSKRPK